VAALPCTGDVPSGWAGFAGNAARHYRLARQLGPEQPGSLGSDGQTSDAAWVAQGLATQLLNPLQPVADGVAVAVQLSCSGRASMIETEARAAGRRTFRFKRMLNTGCDGLGFAGPQLFCIGVAPDLGGVPYRHGRLLTGRSRWRSQPPVPGRVAV